MARITDKFRKILIANRGEIAVRVMQTVQEMGLKAVAVYSDVDAEAEHVRVADEAYHLPGKTAAETYLRGELILEIAKAHQVDAIHPGYGFLSENAGFAEACARAGIVFIGPKPEVIRDMGDKILAKETMRKAGVPVVPGWAGDFSTEYSLIQAEADKIGYPILVKAAAGGGGKGMRLVHSAGELQAALESAGREALKAFGDARVFLEKYITRPRHIEFQIFGDEHGNTVHLFERECSIQRRHQKIIEETPSPALTDELRRQMGEAAVKAAEALGYTNAGTVEFILSETGEFYFLEVNTRLQVEHPVTELTTHQDLVRIQLQVAAGEPLPFSQSELSQDGHAIECRIYAEDPAQNFLPAVGRLEKYIAPIGPGIRLDSGVREGSEITVHYDPMLAKLIVWGKTRDAALEKMLWALCHAIVLGVTTNIAFLARVLEHPKFRQGDIHTHFLEEHSIKATPESIPAEAFMVAALARQVLKGSPKAVAVEDTASSTADAHSPWQAAGHWRAME